MMRHMVDNRALDDLLFQNREKGYGAYYLRKIYHKNLFWSFLLALVIFLVVSLSVLFESYNRSINEIYGLSGSASYEDQSRELEDFLNSYLPSPPQETEQKTPDMSNIQVVEEVTKEQSVDNEIKPPVDSSAFDADSVGFAGNENGPPGMGFGDSPLSLSEVEEMPEFPGGIRALRKYLSTTAKYPEIAMQKKINGTVLVSFCIDNLGNVTDVGLVKAVHPVLDSTAIVAIRNMPRWKPGYQHGRPVKVMITIPMVFVPVN